MRCVEVYLPWLKGVGKLAESCYGIKYRNRRGRMKQTIGIGIQDFEKIRTRNIFYVDNWTVKDTEKAISIFYDN